MEVSPMPPDDFTFDLNLLPYPAQAEIIRVLEESNSDELLTLMLAFPYDSLETTANITKGRWFFDKLFLLLMPHLPLEAALKCRLVCSRWKFIIDRVFNIIGIGSNYYQPAKYSDTFGNFRNHPFGVRYGWDWLNGEEGMTNEPRLLALHEQMNIHPGNPFVFRSVTFSNLNSPTYWNNVKRFVERFGNHIWKLDLEIFMPGPRALMLVRDLLRWTPNLHLLRVDQFNQEGISLENEEEEQLRQILVVSGFPKLPHLENLEILYDINDSNLGFVLHDFMLPQYASQLVQMRMRYTDLMIGYDPVHGNFSNLKLLVLSIARREEETWNDEAQNSEMKASALSQLSGWGCPLLENVTIMSNFRMPLEVYFDHLMSFSQTLKCISIQYGRTADDGVHGLPAIEHNDVGHEEMHFPNLVTVALHNPNPLESLDVLLRIKPGPKSLGINVNSRDNVNEDGQIQEPFHLLFEEMPGELIQVHGYLNRMHESAIWEKIPRLEAVGVVAVGIENEEEIKAVYTAKGQNKL